MSNAYDDCGNNSNYCWAYMNTLSRSGLRWHVCALNVWGRSGYAVVDDFGTLVPVK